MYICWIPSIGSFCLWEMFGFSTVSLGKDFGSNGKQHHKHTASETQSHTQQFHQLPIKIMKYFESSSDHVQIPAFPPVSSVFLALHDN